MISRQGCGLSLGRVRARAGMTSWADVSSDDLLRRKSALGGSSSRGWPRGCVHQRIAPRQRTIILHAVLDPGDILQAHRQAVAVQDDHFAELVDLVELEVFLVDRDPAGFEWVIGDDREQSVLAFLRHAPGRAPAVPPG